MAATPITNFAHRLNSAEFIKRHPEYIAHKVSFAASHGGGDWTLTESQRREQAAALAAAQAKAAPRRFTGSSITGFGALS